MIRPCTTRGHALESSSAQSQAAERHAAPTHGAQMGGSAQRPLEKRVRRGARNTRRLHRHPPNEFFRKGGLGSILDTVSEDTEDTSYSCIFNLSTGIFIKRKSI